MRTELLFLWKESQNRRIVVIDSINTIGEDVPKTVLGRIVNVTDHSDTIPL
jgi:hypothetical protein